MKTKLIFLQTILLVGSLFAQTPHLSHDVFTHNNDISPSPPPTTTVSHGDKKEVVEEASPPPAKPIEIEPREPERFQEPFPQNPPAADSRGNLMGDHEYRNPSFQSANWFSVSSPSYYVSSSASAESKIFYMSKPTAQEALKKMIIKSAQIQFDLQKYIPKSRNQFQQKFINLESQIHGLLAESIYLSDQNFKDLQPLLTELSFLVNKSLANSSKMSKEDLLLQFNKMNEEFENFNDKIKTFM